MAHQGESKENVPPRDSVVPQLSRLSLNENPPAPKNLAIQPPNPPGRTEEERQTHQRFTNEALDMARLALRTNETPVGCVLVHSGTVIAKGMNATNVTRNGTRHAEFMAIAALLARSETGKKTPAAAKGGLRRVNIPTEDTESSGEDENLAARGHLYPYGQKLHSADVVDKSIIRECTLYVTVEPCVMCASLLRQLGIKKVFFGAVNDKFGGTGGVFNIHKNSSPVDGQTDAPRGDGGNVEPGYEVEGGWGRDDAVGLLRRFYVQENGRAPVPRKKEGRAARLAAMEREANGGSMTSTIPETVEPTTAQDSVAGEDNQAQEGHAKLNRQAGGQGRSHEGEPTSNGQAEKNQADGEEPNVIELVVERDRVDQGASKSNGQVEKGQAGDKEANLIEFSDEDNRADEEEPKLNERAAEAMAA
ncbi:hypothetical protein VUR80DRAFT_3535 [Thermomyces stellatus]